MTPRSCCISCTPLRVGSAWCQRVSWWVRDVHAIDDGRKLCIPTGIVIIVLRERWLSEVAIPGSVGGGGWPDSGVVDEAQVTVSGGRAGGECN